MTGAGTIADPFIPTNWDELKTACETADVYISMPSGGSWDMNQQHPAGVPTITSNGTAHIAGHGFTIDNLYAQDTTIFNGKFMITNLDMPSCKLYNSVFFAPSDYGPTFTGFRASGEINNSTFAIKRENYTMNFQQCSLNFRFVGVSRMANPGNYRPVLNFAYSRIELVGATSGDNPFEVKLLVGSKLTGNLTSSNNADFWLGTGSTDCVVDIGLTGFNKVRCMKTKGVNPALLNISKIGTATTEAGDNFIEATSEQMKDAEWLTAHGFPCYVRGE